MESALRSALATRIEAYEEILNRIKKTENRTSIAAIRILTWIFYAARPLRIEELSEALCFEVGSTSIDPTRNLSYVDVVEICQSLVVHEEFSGVVRFVHTTVQEFLRERHKPQVVDLAETCISYLQCGVFDESCNKQSSFKCRVQKYNFFIYAAQFWGLHTRGEPEEMPHIQVAVFQLLESKSRRDSISEMDAAGKEYVKDQTLLHMVAKDGLATICNAHLDKKYTSDLTEAYCK